MPSYTAPRTKLHYGWGVERNYLSCALPKKEVISDPDSVIGPFFNWLRKMEHSLAEMVADVVAEYHASSVIVVECEFVFVPMLCPEHYDLDEDGNGNEVHLDYTDEEGPSCCNITVVSLYGDVVTAVDDIVSQAKKLCSDDHIDKIILDIRPIVDANCAPPIEFVMKEILKANDCELPAKDLWLDLRQSYLFVIRMIGDLYAFSDRQKQRFLRKGEDKFNSETRDLRALLQKVSTEKESTILTFRTETKDLSFTPDVKPISIEFTTDGMAILSESTERNLKFESSSEETEEEDESFSE